MNSLPELTRRQLFASGGVGASALFAAKRLGTTDPDVLTGPEFRVGFLNFVAAGQLLQLRIPGGLLQVLVEEGATVVRDEPTTLDALEVGDELLVQGEQGTDAFLAHTVTPMWRMLRATVTGREGDVLSTTKGPVVINEFTDVPDVVPKGRRRRLEKFQAGDVVIGMMRLAPTWDSWIAATMWAGVRRPAQPAG